MNAVNPVQTSILPSDHAPGAEPSMEEILASIRRIIADDQSLAGPPQAGVSTREVPQEAAVDAPEADASAAPADPVTGDEAMQVPQTPGPEAAAPHDVTGPASETPADAAAAKDTPVDPSEPDHGIHAPQFAMPEGPGSSPAAAPEVAGVGSVDQDLEAALAEVISSEPAPVLGEEPPAPAEALFSRTIDASVTTAFNTLAASRLVANSDELKGVVREMIRPLLKAWIDQHLTEVVERLVSAEIERIARGG